MIFKGLVAFQRNGERTCRVLRIDVADMERCIEGAKMGGKG
jgi:hypothetical protein